MSACCSCRPTPRPTWFPPCRMRRTRLRPVPPCIWRTAALATVSMVVATRGRKPAGKPQLNLNDITRERRAGDLFWSIAHGIPATPMPGFGAQLDETEIWSLVQFLDAQTAAQNALTLSDRLKPVRPVPAPEFTFEFPNRSPMSTGIITATTRKTYPAAGVLYLAVLAATLARTGSARRGYARAGAVIIAIPMNASRILPRLPGTCLGAANRYWRSPALRWPRPTRCLRGGRKMSPRAVQHVEYLVDRFGSIRARGIGVPEARSAMVGADAAPDRCAGA